MASVTFWFVLASLASSVSAVEECLQLVEGQVQNLTCPEGQNIYRIVYADYGASFGNCSSGFSQNPKCTSYNKSMLTATDLCLSYPSCTIAPSNGGVWGPDPCPGYPKTLAVVVDCDSGSHCYDISFSPTISDSLVLQQQPAQAAVFGTIRGNTTNVTVSVTDQGGDSYSVVAAVSQGLWKALLHPTPAGGNYTITATATCSTEQTSATIKDVTFGDVWYCGGQSNQALSLQFTTTRNTSLAAITAGKYSNIRIQQLAGNMNPYLPWTTMAQAAAQPSLFMSFSGLCYYYGESLTDTLAAAGAEVPPLGLIHTGWGGSTIQQWIRNETLNSNVCANHSSGQGNDGGWYTSRVLPYSQMTLKGWTWLQGENNMYSTFGNSALGTGYSCLMPLMIKEWRELWSSTPGTTNPLAPFGLVTLASSGSEGGHNLGSMRLAQTGGYGVLPNAAMPATFLAQGLDMDDPWINSTCSDIKCCPYDFNASHHTTCAGCDGYCNSTAGTPWFMGAIHPRYKKPLGARLAQAAGVSVYGLPGAATGPTLSGCTLNSASGTLTLTFNAQLLGGDTVQVQPYPPAYKNVSASATAVLTDPNGFCFQSSDGHHCADDGSGTAPVNGTDSGWVYVDIAPGGTPNTITLDLARVGGVNATIYGVRYAMADETCCAHYAPSSNPCPVASCPLMGLASRFPANPFMAHIVGGKCKCIPPQVCDE